MKQKAKIINQVRLTLPSRSVNEGFVRSAVSACASQLDPTPLELADIKCAVSEAMTNSIVHAYPDGIGKIRVKLTLRDDRSVEVEISDSGVGIADIKAAREPLFTTDPGGERSGMGFTVMESFTDRLRVRSSPGRGTTVIMTKYLKSPEG